MLRQGVHPVWVQSTWAGITPLLAADLPKDYSLTRAVGIFGQVMSEYLLTYMLAHERQFLGRLASQVGSQWDSRTPGGLRGRQVVIVGTGEIGQAVAHTLSGFGMDLTGVAKNPRSLVPFNRMGSLDDLGRLVETADYLINLLPDTPIPTTSTTVRCSPGSSPRRCSSMPGVVSRWWTPTWWRHWRTTNWPAR